MLVQLRGGAKIYVNGGVLRVDRRVGVELLNDMTFLLDSHVMQPEAATTPLRQLYFAAQTALMDPAGRGRADALLFSMFDSLEATIASPELRAGLAEARAKATRGRHYDVLKALRALYPVEERILAGARPSAV